VADVPADTLVLGGGAPVYVRKQKAPGYLKKIARFDLDKIAEPKNYKNAAKKLWNLPNLASKNWITRQYDSTVRTGNMNTNRPSDAAVVYVKETGKAIVLTTDCNAAYVYADPHKGAMIAVAEAARNIVCAGGEPVAVTNCLNFGNPYNPEVYFQFAQAIKGMGDACRRFETPVTGGNVSFYNQYTQQGQTVPVFPTPTIGMLGLMEDIKKMMTLDFKNEGDHIYLIGSSRNDLGSSEYLRSVLKKAFSPCPHFDLEEEHALQQTLRKIISSGHAQSVHDLSDGGLLAALLESAMPQGFGFSVKKNTAVRKDCWLFGEAQSRAIVSVAPGQAAALEKLLQAEKTPFEALGTVTKDRISIDGEDWGRTAVWQKTWQNCLGDIMA
jgi:phosphoribosylformylglycinamidine synthase subunit PurL